MARTEGGNSIRTKHANQVAIREMIYRSGPITRAEISRRLELTLPTITTTVNTMLSAGIVRECAQQQGGEHTMGRPALPVDIVPEAAYVIGAEMRGTCRCVCIADLRGRKIWSAIDENLVNDYEAALESVSALIRHALSADAVPAGRIVRLCVCTPGVHSDDGRLLVHPGYNWKDKPLREDIAARTGFTGEILTANNARARAFGTLLFHPQLTKEASSFAYLLISTGIACPLILSPGITASTALGVGEVGHMVVDPAGPRCRCGNRGCLEALASDRAVLSAFREAVRRSGDPALQEKCRRGTLTIRDVTEAQERGDSAAEEAIGRAIRYIGLAVANIYNFIRPDVLFIEGAVFRNDANQSALLSVVDENLYTTAQGANFVFLESDPLSGALGAAGTAVRDYLSDYKNMEQA